VSQLVFSLSIAVVAFWAAYEVAYPRLFGTPVAEVKALSLEETIVDLKNELVDLADIPGPNLDLELGDIKLQLTTQRDKIDSSKVALAVPVFNSTALSSGTENNVTQGSKITVVFAPPKGGVVLSSGDSDGLDLSDLVLAARAALIATAEQPPALVPKKIDIELDFVLVQSSANAGHIEAHVITLGGGSEAISKNGNKLVLSFAKRDAEMPTPPR